jgi:hypothetical protein
MRLANFLSEKRTNNVIIVDVQPMYQKHISFDMGDFCEFLSGQRDLLFFYNGESIGSEDRDNKLKQWYIVNGLDRKKALSSKYIDKGYGFFRGWMDIGIEPGTIKKAIRFMLEKKVNDSRDIDEDEWRKTIPDLDDEAGSDWYQEPIYLPGEINIGFLKKWQGSYICGGGESACLKEMLILFSTFNITVIKVEAFIYQ